MYMQVSATSLHVCNAHSLCPMALACTCVRAYVRTCVRAYVRTCVRAYVRTRAYTCVHAYVRTCVRTYVRVCVYKLLSTCDAILLLTIVCSGKGFGDNEENENDEHCRRRWTQIPVRNFTTSYFMVSRMHRLSSCAIQVKSSWIRLNRDNCMYWCVLNKNDCVLFSLAYPESR